MYYGSISVLDSADKDIRKTPLLQEAYGWVEGSRKANDYNVAWSWYDIEISIPTMFYTVMSW